MEFKKKILYPKGAIRATAEHFGVTTITVGKIFMFQAKEYHPEVKRRHDEIRQWAIDNLGCRETFV